MSLPSSSIRRAQARLDQSRRATNALVRRLALADRVRAGELPFYVARRRHVAAGNQLDASASRVPRSLPSDAGNWTGRR